MKVTQLMTKEIVSIDLDDSLEQIKEIFDLGHFHHLLVTDHSRLFGVISDRDLLKAISPNIGKASENLRDLATLNKRAHQILTRKPITLKTDASIYDVIAIFNQHRISCIPIVNDKNAPKGIVTWRDVMKVLGQRYQEKNNDN